MGVPANHAAAVAATTALPVRSGTAPAAELIACADAVPDRCRDGIGTARRPYGVRRGR
jgi:hypothetical protein